jgi:hypothetical protein
MLLTQRECRWTEPFEVESIAARDTVLSLFTDVREDQVSDRGYAVTRMSNGDKFFFHYVSLELRNGGMPGNSVVFSGGTGIFAAISGAGTFSIRRIPDGTIVVRFRCTYSFPSR